MFRRNGCCRSILVCTEYNGKTQQCVTWGFITCVCFVKMEDASFPSGGSTVGVNSASSKADAGRGNGPLPLGGSGLMEEMSALLARR